MGVSSVDVAVPYQGVNTTSNKWAFPIFPGDAPKCTQPASSASFSRHSSNIKLETSEMIPKYISYRFDKNVTPSFMLLKTNVNMLNR